ncbi:hypothetical protein BU17DRAFT_41342 [Hysterangium stoloniferum]|nr:hypothetical protein BU17DRAFT_41342 [Hysterangium stoloniferum]
MTSSLYLCVDCGGTKTSAVICDSTGQVVGRALGGPSNFSYLGLQPFVKVLQSTVQNALHSATHPSGDIESLTLNNKFASVWIGVSGADSPNDVHTLTTALSPVFSIPPGNRLQVTNDANLLASPLKSHPELKSAVAIIAGTGSVVVSFTRGEEQVDGPTPLKEMARVAGWGWILGDVGSGFEIGRETIREILKRADRSTVEGLPATSPDPDSLQSRVLSHFGVTSVPDLFGVIYAPDPRPDADNNANQHPTSLVPRERRLSQITPLVFEAAFKNGDELALTVIRRCGEIFADIIASVLAPPSGASGRNAVEAASSVLCLGGSLLGISDYRNIILEGLERRGHVFALVEFVGGGDVSTAGAKGMAVTENPR